MKVILLQDIENFGKKYEVKEVKDGYARNFLIPKGLVKIATEEAIKWVEVQKEIGAKKSEEELKKIQTSASSIDGTEVIISVKIGEKEQLFEKVSAQKISEKLKEMGFEVKKTQIVLTEPLQALGEFPVKVKFDHNLEAEITVVVVEEK
jgi:large subunit ribosomal protein L9